MVMSLSLWIIFILVLLDLVSCLTHRLKKWTGGGSGPPHGASLLSLMRIKVFFCAFKVMKRTTWSCLNQKNLIWCQSLWQNIDWLNSFNNELWSTAFNNHKREKPNIKEKISLFRLSWLCCRQNVEIFFSNRDSLQQSFPKCQYPSLMTGSIAVFWPQSPTRDGMPSLTDKYHS